MSTMASSCPLIANAPSIAFSTFVITRSGDPWPWIMWPPFITSLGSALLFWELTYVTHPNLIQLGVFQAIMGFSGGCYIQVSSSLLLYLPHMR